MTDAPVAAAAPGGRGRRPRRARSATESLVSIALILEAVVVFFAALTVFGLRALPMDVALIGGGIAIALLVIASGIARWRAGIAFGAVLQVLFLGAGVILPVLLFVSVPFVALWVFCLVRGIQLDRANAARAAVADPPPNA